eukprot:GFUD01006424.1.p1 GENE.GFUD01006424.1~~GFUD01006424.1.p1  ORF type:complete len:117 (+),score=11.45 GFUD01006424.1:808-1158(+)
MTFSGAVVASMMSMYRGSVVAWIWGAVDEVGTWFLKAIISGEVFSFPIVQFVVGLTVLEFGNDLFPREVVKLKIPFLIGTAGTAPDLVKVKICLSVPPVATAVTANTLCEAASLGH